MPIDRAATLRNAEKLLRQGKLDSAITEYLRVVEDQPRDWNTRNILGDLYVRAGSVDKAVGQFREIADSLSHDGFLPKAAALYKKILKIKPDDEHALLQAGEVAARQGLLADARSYLEAVIERRRARGDEPGAAEVRIRVGALAPNTVETRSLAAQARGSADDVVGGSRDLTTPAADLTEKGRDADGSTALREVAPPDPSDVAVRVQEARRFVARGDLAPAAAFVNGEAAGDDPTVVLTCAETEIRAGRADEGLRLLRRLLDGDRSSREAIARLGWDVAERAPDAGFSVVELAAEASVADSDWVSAAAVLQTFVTRVPTHVPGLKRLVEVSVDGGLDAVRRSAQAQLADVYVAIGAAQDARVIAEDLVAREPWERANIERFRRVLILLGETDPDAVIAERLSGERPFTSTEWSTSVDLPPFETPGIAQNEPSSVSAPIRTVAADRRGQTNQFELSANAIDLDSILEEFESAPRDALPDGVEVDLSFVLDDIKPVSSNMGSPTGRPPLPIQASDLDGVFEQLRGEASRDVATAVAEEAYRRGLALHAAGEIDASIQALQAASRAPSLRFQAASSLGRIYRSQGATAPAIEWFERAVEAPAPTAEEGHQLLYELAGMLESVGEVARALAVCLELKADVSEYRDLGERIARLTSVQSRG